MCSLEATSADLNPGLPRMVTTPTLISLVPRAIGISPADSASAASGRWSHRGTPRSPALLTIPRPIDETPSLSALDVSTRARRVQMKRGLGMIIIDYLQLLNSTGRRKENRQQEVSEISRELKILARDLDVPVIALSQLSREVEHKHPPVPVLSDLRDSGSIEQDADMVMFIDRGDLFEPNTDVGAQLLVLKQRNGPTGEVRLVFHDIFARFDERAEPHQERLALQRVR
jgi:replicative DNA helicase